MPDPVPSRARVFDSSSLLAVLLGERGGNVVIPILESGLLSTVNLVEVHTRMVSLGAEPSHAWSSILDFQCDICPLTETQARIAAELITTTRPFGLSLGDRACLALAIERNAKVYTADRTWKNLNLGIEVEVIR